MAPESQPVQRLINWVGEEEEEEEEDRKNGSDFVYLIPFYGSNDCISLVHGLQEGPPFFWDFPIRKPRSPSAGTELGGGPSDRNLLSLSPILGKEGMGDGTAEWNLLCNPYLAI